MNENDPDGKTTNAETEAEDVFAVLGNEIRVELLRILGKAWTEDGRELSFSELRSLTETTDPGQLSYHLQQLLGHFVQKRQDGYKLRPEGLHLYKTIHAGIFERQQENFSVDAGFHCYFCQSSVETTFFGGKAMIECPECEYRYLGYLTENIAPSLKAFEDERTAFEQFSKSIHHELLGYARGVCPTCGNHLETRLVAPEEVPKSKIERPKVYAHKTCIQCDTVFNLFLGVALLADPGLLSFCYRHDVDVFSTPYWELEFAATDNFTTVRSTDPWEVALHVNIDGAILELVVDGGVTVIERNHLGTAANPKSLLLRGVQSTAHTLNREEHDDNGHLPAKSVCLEYIRNHRWADGVSCPDCDSSDNIKKGTTSKEAQRYRCNTCGSSFNDLTNTIFAEHRLSLPEMFFIIQKMDETDVAKIARRIDRSYKAVLDFAHKAREELEEGTD